MPLIRLLKDSVLGTAVLPAGRVVDLSPIHAERFTRAGRGVVVPPGTESDPEPDADEPEHETADARPSGERATLRRGR